MADDDAPKLWYFKTRVRSTYHTPRKRWVRDESVRALAIQIAHLSDQEWSPKPESKRVAPVPLPPLDVRANTTVPTTATTIPTATTANYDLVVSRLVYGKDVAAAATSRRPVIEIPFGSRALDIFRFACTPETYANVFAQIVADRRQEINDALQAGRTKRAEWIKWRGRWDLFEAALIVIAGRVAKSVLTVRRLLG